MDMILGFLGVLLYIAGWFENSVAPEYTWFFQDDSLVAISAALRLLSNSVDTFCQFTVSISLGVAVLASILGWFSICLFLLCLLRPEIWLLFLQIWVVAGLVGLTAGHCVLLIALLRLVANYLFPHLSRRLQRVHSRGFARWQLRLLPEHTFRMVADGSWRLSSVEFLLYLVLVTVACGWALGFMYYCSVYLIPWLGGSDFRQVEANT